jgi:hypothetical protein
MQQSPSTSPPPAVPKERTSAGAAEWKVIFGLVGTGASVAGLVVLAFMAAGYQLSINILLLSVGLTAVLTGALAYFSRSTRPFAAIEKLAYRSYLSLPGMSKTAFLVDLLRILALLILGASALKQHATQLLTSTAGIVFLSALGALYLHTLVYPFLKGRSFWNDEYRKRKSLAALAISYASFSVERSNVTLMTVQNIEINALKAIKSYIEYTALDTVQSFNVNFIVLDPNRPNRLVCIQRVNPIRPVPTFYQLESMPEATQAIQTMNPVYVGDYVNPDKDYKMIWHVPVTLRHVDETRCLGLLSIDSKKRRHLEFFGDRKHLLDNLSPYIALLRYSLALRDRHNIWHDLA